MRPIQVKNMAQILLVHVSEAVSKVIVHCMYTFPKFGRCGPCLCISRFTIVNRKKPPKFVRPRTASRLNLKTSFLQVDFLRKLKTPGGLIQIVKHTNTKLDSSY